MANYSTLKAAIADVIKTNGNNEITGELLQQSLLSMINSLGADYQFAGVATPTTNPGTPDQNVFYIARFPGIYSNFGGVLVDVGEIVILKYDQNGWTYNRLQEKLGARPAYVDGYSDVSDMLCLVKGYYYDYGTGKIASFDNAVSTLFPIPISGGVSVKYTGNLQYNAAIFEYDENFNIVAEHHGAGSNTLTFTTNAATKFVDFCALYIDSFNVKIGIDYTSTPLFFYAGNTIAVELIKSLYKKLPEVVNASNILYGVVRPNNEYAYVDITQYVPKAKGMYYDYSAKGIRYYDTAIACAIPVPIPGNVDVDFTGVLYGTAGILEYDEKLNVITYHTSTGVFTTNAKTRFVGFCSLNQNSFIIKVRYDYSASFFEKGITELFTLIRELYINKNLSCQKESLIGSIPFEGFNADGYSHIILYGQSLSTGDNSYVPVTGVLTTPVPDVYMVGVDPTDTVGAFAQLKAKTPNNSSYIHSNGGESPICNAVYAIKSFLNHTPYKNVKIIGSACGYGGTTIEQLGNVDGQYYNRFKTVVSTAKINAGDEKINCPAIVWMQGEYNQRSSDTTTVADYKQKLVALKNNMQQYVMTVYGQTQRPLFFVYQPSVLFTPKFPIVAQALFECAQENEDIILMNPHYFCPTSDGGHLTSNGYRWYGEYIAKAILKAVVNNIRPSAIVPVGFKLNDDKTKLFIRLLIPNKNQLKDNWTVAGVSNLGFAIYKNNSAITIKSVDVHDEFIELSFDALGSYTKLEIEYAGQATNGVGNIADSDDYVSFGEFIDPSTIYVAGASTDANYTEAERTMLINSDLAHHDENGNALSGKKYPNKNWMNTFRIDITGI